jgi:hypothetical protein
VVDADIPNVRDPVEVAARLRSKVVVDEFGCHIFTGALDPSGYGALSVDGKKVGAHRVAYELAHGKIGAGQVIHHFYCGCRRCVNPAHLESVERSVNSSIQLPRAPRRRCLRGHALHSANVLVESSGKRRCATCRRAYGREWARRHRTEVQAGRSGHSRQPKESESRSSTRPAPTRGREVGAGRDWA